MKINTKKVFIKTFGCQMNVRDSEFVAGVLIDSGFRLVDSPGKADVLLFNSCSVRKRAEDRLFGNITDLGGLKKKKPSLVIGLMGCTAQAYKDEAFKKAPMIDIVCGPGNESDLPQLIRDVIGNRCAIVAADKIDEKRPELFPGYRSEGFKSYVSIGEGCNNFCSYCIVPYVRGRERSRDAKDIIKEARDLAARGFKEITLLGQNVNSYAGIGFVGLLEKMNNIKGIERIRFMTSHPKDAHIELFKAMRDLEKVCGHLHLPLQSGSDRILKLMNRGYTAKKYMALARKFKKLLPEGSITTDIIVGFPSETEKDFKKTCAVMDTVGFDNAFIFQYSPRPKAKASGLKDDVTKEAKVRRLQAIVELQCRSSEKHNRSLAGKTVEVLVDGVNRKDRTQLSGRTRTNRTVVFRGKRDLVGQLINIKVRSATPYALIGK